MRSYAIRKVNPKSKSLVVSLPLDAPAIYAQGSEGDWKVSDGINPFPKDTLALTNVRPRKKDNVEVSNAEVVSGVEPKL